jgi:hypothetical protein
VPTSSGPIELPPPSPWSDDEVRVTIPGPAATPVAGREIDPSVTEPAMPPADRTAGWSRGLAARIDAALDSSEWSKETPIAPPSSAELRALLGHPDPTREQPIDELALLQRRAAGLSDGEPHRRSPHPTAEVDPDDIEAAIELAPPARRPTHGSAIGSAKPKPKPKKSE